jgi:hypothetical protein
MRVGTAPSTSSSLRKCLAPRSPFYPLLAQGHFGDQLEDLLGFDTGASVGFECGFAPTDLEPMGA